VTYQGSKTPPQTLMPALSHRSQGTENQSGFRRSNPRRLSGFLSDSVPLVEGLFDLAVLWQAGFRKTTSGLGCHLTAQQFAQLCENFSRRVFIAFDSDANAAGQRAAAKLAAQLRNAGSQSWMVRLPVDTMVLPSSVAGMD
jgi:Toprim-like